MVTLEKAWDNANDLSVYINTLEEKKEKSQLKISKGRKIIKKKKNRKKTIEKKWITNAKTKVGIPLQIIETLKEQ